jgi:ureidoglycolate lyase
MNTVLLTPEPLTKAAFAPFGDVIETDGAEHFSINLGTVERFHDLARVDIDYDGGGRPIISLVTINSAQGVPFQIKLIERHPKASQAFIPMFDKPVYVVVGLPSQKAEPENLKAFVTNGKQGFNYKAGVWHMPLIGDTVGQCFVVVDQAGLEDNCDESVLVDHAIELRESRLHK